MPRMTSLLLLLLLPSVLPAQQQPAARTVPLTELGSALYKGYEGGLYGSGSNARPAAHDAAGLQLAARVLPRDTAGAPDPARGRIVLLSIGMSNTTNEFSMFKAVADTDRAKNPRVLIVDGAQGGQTASIIANPTASFWTVVDQRLAAAGARAAQVQAVWYKEANAGPTQAFPVHAQMLRDHMVANMQILRSRYPNLKLVYCSSRTYGGYATTALNPEPYAYETGFAVRWMIERQLGGDTALAFAGAAPRAPWLAWGPYLWADSLTPRADGLMWERSDFAADGTHPSNSGRLKVARLLLDFLKADATARAWFLASLSGAGDAPGALPEALRMGSLHPNPMAASILIPVDLPADDNVVLRITDALGRELWREARHLPAGTSTLTWNRGAAAPGVCYVSVSNGGSIVTRPIVLSR